MIDQGRLLAQCHPTEKNRSQTHPTDMGRRQGTTQFRSPKFASHHATISREESGSHVAASNMEARPNLATSMWERSPPRDPSSMWERVLDEPERSRRSPRDPPPAFCLPNVGAGATPRSSSRLPARPARSSRHLSSPPHRSHTSRFWALTSAERTPTVKPGWVAEGAAAVEDLGPSSPSALLRLDEVNLCGKY